MIPAITETEFQKQVTDLAEMLGWSWLHVVRMGNRNGEWRTPTVGPLGKGFPDLLLVKGAQVLFVELKGPAGFLSASQKLLRDGPLKDQRYHVWRPSDWALVMEVLHA